MLPLSPLGKAAANCCAQRKCPAISTAHRSAKCCAAMRSKEDSKASRQEALATKIRGAPYRFTISANAVLTLRSSVTSITTGIILPDDFRAGRERSVAALRDAAITTAPSPAKRRQIAEPIKPLPPVTTAISARRLKPAPSTTEIRTARNQSVWPRGPSAPPAFPARPASDQRSGPFFPELRAGQFLWLHWGGKPEAAADAPS